jgi:GNAT superfamily N-acetyltransferase
MKLIARGPRNPGSIEFRPMYRGHFPDVVVLDAATSTRPMGEEVILGLLSERTGYGSVAVLGRHVVGFCLWHERLEAIVVHAVRVDPQHQGQGIGRQMVSRLGVGTRSRALEAEIPDDELETHLFLKAIGFDATCVLWGASPSGGDVYRFRYGGHL